MCVASILVINTVLLYIFIAARIFVCVFVRTSVLFALVFVCVCVLVHVFVCVFVWVSALVFLGVDGWVKCSLTVNM